MLSGESFRQLGIPPRSARGLCMLSDRVHAEYKCTDFYDRANEIAGAGNDPEIGIDWPDIELHVSDRDAAAPRLAEVADTLPFAY